MRDEIKPRGRSSRRIGRARVSIIAPYFNSGKEAKVAKHGAPRSIYAHQSFTRKGEGSSPRAPHSGNNHNREGGPPPRGSARATRIRSTQRPVVASHDSRPPNRRVRSSGRIPYKDRPSTPYIKPSRKCTLLAPLRNPERRCISRQHSSDLGMEPRQDASPIKKRNSVRTPPRRLRAPEAHAWQGPTIRPRVHLSITCGRPPPTGACRAAA